jgi:heptaprenylglyceryl phosphate synthase
MTIGIETQRACVIKRVLTSLAANYYLPRSFIPQNASVCSRQTDLEVWYSLSVPATPNWHVKASVKLSRIFTVFSLEVIPKYVFL